MRSRADLLEAEQAELAGLMQMDVDPDAPPLRQGEDGVELPSRVAVDHGGIDAADEIGAGVERRIHEVDDARASHHAALREGHDLDRDAALIGFANRQDLMQGRKAHLEMHVDMRSDMRRAIGDAAVEQQACPASRGHGELGQDLLVGFDPAHPGRPRGMGHPGQAEQGLVEMHVPVDQARQDQVPAKIHDVRVGRLGNLADRQ